MDSTAALSLGSRLFLSLMLFVSSVKNRLFLSFLKATATMPAFSLVLQTDIYIWTFLQEILGKCKQRKLFIKNLEVAFASKTEDSVNGHIRCKNKHHMGVILQRSENSTVAFLWVLSGESLLPKTHWYVFKGLGSDSAKRGPPCGQGCITHSADLNHGSRPSRQSKCINQLQDLYFLGSLPAPKLSPCPSGVIHKEFMKILRFIKPC